MLSISESCSLMSSGGSGSGLFVLSGSTCCLAAHALSLAETFVGYSRLMQDDCALLAGIVLFITHSVFLMSSGGSGSGLFVLSGSAFCLAVHVLSVVESFMGYSGLMQDDCAILAVTVLFLTHSVFVMLSGGSGSGLFGRSGSTSCLVVHALSVVEFFIGYSRLMQDDCAILAVMVLFIMHSVFLMSSGGSGSGLFGRSGSTSCLAVHALFVVELFIGYSGFMPDDCGILAVMVLFLTHSVWVRCTVLWVR